MGYTTFTRAFNRLPEETREVARTVSALGQRFDIDLLGRVTGRNEAELKSALKRLVDGEIVYKRNVTVWEFVHTFMRTAVYQSISKPERQALHTRIVDALGPEADPSVLARHLELAGRLEEAIAALKAAGRRHLGQWALAECALFTDCKPASRCRRGTQADNRCG